MGRVGHGQSWRKKVDWDPRQFREDVNPVKERGKRGIGALDNSGRMGIRQGRKKKGDRGPRQFSENVNPVKVGGKRG
jgi:hypothetical protein